MPPNTVYVGRGSRWGNPFVVGRDGDTAEECIALYVRMMTPYRHHGPRNGLEDFFISTAMIAEIQYHLKGKNLACWCQLDQPCHADFLLETANDVTLEL